MDEARYFGDDMADEWENRIEEIKELVKKLNLINGIRVKDDIWAKNSGYNDKDITRLVVDVSSLGSGIEVGKILEDKYGIFMEMTTFKYLLGIMTPWDKKEWDNMLYEALSEISKLKLRKISIPDFPNKNIKAMKIGSTEKKIWEKILLRDARNKVSAESVGVYPPGVPLILPGEIITQEIIKYMQEMEELGGSLFGVEKGYINCIKEEH